MYNVTKNITLQKAITWVPSRVNCIAAKSVHRWVRYV